MVRKKVKSKRLPLRRKYRIQSKVREHNRKIRRATKKDDNGKKKSEKDPGIPNLWPFKEEMMMQLENKRIRHENKLVNQKEQRDKAIKKRRLLASGTSTVQQLKENADMKNVKFVEDEDSASINTKNTKINALKDSSKKAFFRKFKEVVAASDVILEVLDARFPMGCRCKRVEQYVTKLEKKLILILNKKDLIPQDVFTAWLKYLKNEYPTIEFIASQHDQKKKKSSIMNVGSKKVSEKQGAEALLQLLKNYCRSSNLKTAITVGVVGYPNVGKSSVINSLLRSKSVGVSSVPGFTKTVHEVHLDKNIKLLDTPGVVLNDQDNISDMVLQNSIRVEQLEDPVDHIENVISRCDRVQLAQLYNVPSFSSATEFLLHIARKRGLFSKGGVPNSKAAATAILRDWNSGKIPFWTLPPSENRILETKIIFLPPSESNMDEIPNIIENNDGDQAPTTINNEDDTTTALFRDACSSDDESESEDPDLTDDDSACDSESKDVINPPISIIMGQQQLLHEEEEEELNPKVNATMRKRQKRSKKKVRKNETKEYNFRSDFFGITLDQEDADENDMNDA